LFPDERWSVDSKNIDADVAVKENGVEHLQEDSRVRIFEIPLVAVKDRHHPLADLLAIREVSRRRFRKNFWHAALETVRHAAIGEHVVVVVLEGQDPALGPSRPFVVMRSVI